MSKLILGCGYLGYRVALKWQAEGDDVYAVTRNPQRAKQWEKDGLLPIVADLLQEQSLPQLPAVDTVLYALGYDRTGELSIGEAYRRAIQNVFNKLSPEVGRFIYVSSTGVYGQNDGSWVDEQSPCQPATEGGQAHYEVEEFLRQSSLSQRLIVLRLGGLYGPNRLPRKVDLIQQRPIPTPAESYLNLIHVDDAVQLILAAQKKFPLPRLYLGGDNQPTKRHDYLTELARLLNSPAPQFDEDITENIATDRPKRGLTNKRICNQRMLEELKIELLYPTFREGLAAILSDEN